MPVDPRAMESERKQTLPAPFRHISSPTDRSFLMPVEFLRIARLYRADRAVEFGDNGEELLRLEGTDAELP